MFQLPIPFGSIHRVAIRINEYFAVYHEFLMKKMCELVLILRLRSDGSSIQPLKTHPSITSVGHPICLESPASESSKPIATGSRAFFSLSCLKK